MAAGSFPWLKNQLKCCFFTEASPDCREVPYPLLQAISQPVTYFIILFPIWNDLTYSSLFSPLECKLLKSMDMSSSLTAEPHSPKQCLVHSRISINIFLNESTIWSVPDPLTHVLWEQCLESAFLTSASDNLYAY